MKITVPAKVFVLGEYLALAGGPAWVGTLPQSFELEALPQSPEMKTETPFHPASPAGIWLNRHSELSQAFQFIWRDPFAGSGGFGASTAQFVALRALELGITEPALFPAPIQEVWQSYRALFEGKALPPSGADLVMQWRGGHGVWWGKQAKLEELPGGAASGFSLLVFSATHLPDRKVATHEHLDDLPLRFAELKSQGGLLKLETLVDAGTKAWKENQGAKVGAALDGYAQLLSEFGLEAQASADQAAQIRKIPGVFGAKGCGAMLSDAILVCAKTEAIPEVRAMAQNLNLNDVGEVGQ